MYYAREECLSRIDHTWVENAILGSYWGGWRSRELIQESLKNSICFVGLMEEPFIPIRTVGFARVVTDYATFSWICDVIVDERHRKNGIGKMLMEAIEKHPVISKTVALLRTKDAHGLYSKFGYEATDAMRRIPKKSTSS